MHAHANDNTRPASFDAKLLAYRKGLFALAKRRGFFGDEADDLVNDVYVRCLANWQSYREGISFHAYLWWTMRGIITERQRRKSRRPVVVPMRADIAQVAQPNQEHYTDLSLVLSKLEGRNGTVVLRQAMGDDLAEIGRDMGVCREAARKLADTQRRRLVKCGVAA